MLRKPPRVVQAGAAAAAAGAIYYVYSQHQLQAKSARDKKKAAPRSRPAPIVTSRQSSVYLRKILALLFQAGSSKVLAVALLALFKTLLTNYQGKLQGNLFKTAFLKQVYPFARLLLENVAICLVTSTVESTSRHLLSRLDIQWRGLLTRRIQDKYFANMAYYQMSYVDKRIPDPEQHMCEDIGKLSTALSGLSGELTSSVIDAVFNAIRLYQYSHTNRYTAAMIAYIFSAGALTMALAPGFGKLIKKSQELEGRYSMLQERLQANIEPVALLGGIDREAVAIESSFSALVKHTQRVLQAQLYSGITSDFLLKYLGATVAVVLIIGPFFGGHMKPDATLLGRAQMLSDMRYHTSVVISMFAALGILATSTRKWAKLSGYSTRLCAMEHVLRDISSTSATLACKQPDYPSPMKRVGSRVVSQQDEISFEHVTVVTPADTLLVRDLTLSVPHGTNLLVTGPNGAGKSSLFRVLGGLWHLQEGVIRKPGSAEDGLSHHIFYVPQRPYVMAGTLLEQLIYPLTLESQVHAMTTEDAKALLAKVDLQHLLARYGGDTHVQWNEVLSLGEQQRLGMARLLYHTPRFAILDECTSGVTMDMEERFTELLKGIGCTCITISHRPALVAFHDLVLALDGEGGWKLLPGARKRPALPSSDSRPALSAAMDGGVSHVRSSDADVVNTAMSTVPASADASTAQRTVRAQVVNTPGTLVSYKASNASRALVVRERLAPVRSHLLARPPAASAVHANAVGTFFGFLGFTGNAQWSVVLKVLFSGAVGQARSFAAIGVIVLLRTALQDRIARLNGRTVEHVLKQDRRAFIRLVGVSVLQSLGSAILAPSLKYATDALALTWRRRLTRYVHSAYLRENTAHATSQLAGMGDADQRVTRDVEKVATDLANLVPTLVKPVFDIAWFSLQMGQLTGVAGLGMLYGYMVAGYLALRVLTPDFAALTARGADLEALFRKAHHYLKQHAESVAFFGGGAREGGTISRHLDALLAQLLKVSKARWAHAIVDDLLSKQLPHNATWCLTMLYALQRDDSAWSDSTAQGATVFQMRYLATVVANCFLAFGEILAMHTRLAELTGGVSRVADLISVVTSAQTLQRDIALHNVTSSTTPLPNGDVPLLQLGSVAVVTPGGHTLAKHISIQVLPHRNLLVTGPNGSGKSAIFRVLRGLWPLVAGTISVAGDPAQWKLCSDVFYVPQQPYLSECSLLEQLIYPLALEDALVPYGLAKGKIAGRGEAMRQLKEALDDIADVVRLAYLIKREGGWNTVKNWGSVLSLGEQQRMGMARLFYHRPKLAILDECTNATSVDVEQQLYEHAQKLGITIITVTQRPALVRHHKQELRLLDGEGHWQLCDLS